MFSIKYQQQQAGKVRFWEKLLTFLFSDIYWVPSMFRVRTGVKISSGLSGLRSLHCSIQREIQIPGRRVTGTNLDKTLDTQQTDKIRHRTNFVSVSVLPMRGSAIDLMTNKRMGGRLKPLSLGSCLPKSHQIKSPRWGKKDWPRPESH